MIATEHRSVTQRLYPTSPAKGNLLNQLEGASRHVWNQHLETINREYQKYLDGERPDKPSVSCFSAFLWFTQYRKATPWLQELPFGTIRYSLKYQCDAWKQFFNGTAGKPQFKSKHRGRNSFTVPDLKPNQVTGKAARIPVVGWVALSGKNPYSGCVPVRMTGYRQCGKRYMTTVYKVEIEVSDDGKTIGLDLNAGQSTDSDGDRYGMTGVSRLQARTRRYQRMMARRQKGSKRRKKARRLCAKTQRRIANIRKNDNHHHSKAIAGKAGTVVMENLQIKNMTKSARGTRENPGRGVRQKAGLNRAITMTGWGQLGQFVGYKAYRIIKVPAQYTSRTCCECGHEAKANRISQARFMCAACGHTANADLNAALNILARGNGATGLGRGVHVLKGGVPGNGPVALSPGSDLYDPSTRSVNFA